MLHYKLYFLCENFIHMQRVILVVNDFIYFLFYKLNEDSSSSVLHRAHHGKRLAVLNQIYNRAIVYCNSVNSIL